MLLPSFELKKLKVYTLKTSRPLESGLDSPHLLFLNIRIESHFNSTFYNSIDIKLSTAEGVFVVLQHKHVYTLYNKPQ